MYNRLGNLFFRKRTKEQVIIPCVNLCYIAEISRPCEDATMRPFFLHFLTLTKLHAWGA